MRFVFVSAIIFIGAMGADHALAAPSPSDDAVSFAETGSRPLGIQGRVINGTEVTTEARYPWVVSLRYTYDPKKAAVHFCGGSIVGPSLIVTAAHCVDRLVGREGALSIWYGSTRLSRGGSSVQAAEILVHPDKRVVTIPLAGGKFYEVYDNDIALVSVRGTFPDSTHAKVLKPVNESLMFGDGALVTVAGWGLTETGQPAETLRHLGLKLVPRRLCNSVGSYDGNITENMVCAGFIEGGRDSCKGDSGGPLMAYDGEGGLVLAGVVSWGEGCAMPKKYGVYVRAPRFYSWIMDALAASGR